MSGFESVVGINPWTALFTFCNMMLSFLFLKKFLFKPVKNMIASRQKDIDDKYDAADRAKNEAEALKADYQHHLANEKAADDIARERNAAFNEVKNEISGIAMEIASKVVEKEITAADHQRLVEEFIGKIGEDK